MNFPQRLKEKFKLLSQSDINRFVQLLEENKISQDLFDFFAMDSETGSINHLLQQIKLEYGLNLPSQREEAQQAKVEEDKVKHEEQQRITAENEEARAEVSQWKQERHNTVKVEEFQIPEELIEVTLSSEDYHCLLLHGEGGIGKTVLTLGKVKTLCKPEEWIYLNGYSTPLGLYESLWNNRHAKVIILDDVEGLFDKPIAMSILKGALWESDGKRLVQYVTKSEKAESLPGSFIITAKIIILCNKINRERDLSVRAMITRTINHEVKFSYLQKLKICESFVNESDLNKGQKNQTLEILKAKTNEATKDFNFRTLRKLIAFVKHSKSRAEDLFCATTEQDDLKTAYLAAEKEGDTIAEASEDF